MNVYIWTSGVLKNDYIGEVFEYSYDFRGKSVAKMQSDGWNIFLNSNYAIFNSNWINTNSTNNAIMAKIENLNSIIKNSKKITLSFTGAITNAFSGRLSLFNEATSSTRRWITWPYASNYGSSIQTSLYTTDITDSRTVNSTMKVTTVLDFTAKTWKTTATDGYSRSGTLTDTQISNIKDNSKWFYIFASTSTSNTNWGLTSIYVLVE